MKDYSLTKEQQKDYLLDFKLKQNGEEETYDVVYADGKVFGHVTANEENLAKIERVQEAQAKNGVANKHVFVSRRSKSGVLTALSAAVSGFAGYGLTIMAATAGLMPEGLPIAAGVGLITILGTIPAFAKLLKNHGKVKELEKIEYRDEHAEALAHIDDYANSLSGVSSKVVSLLEGEENPFSILNIDRFTQADLETIVDNMEREKKSGFVYTKAK